MSKIVQAVNSMISNRDSLSPVVQGESEIFFVYRGKYVWSMTKRESLRETAYLLWYYPDETIDSLLKYSDPDWDRVRMIAYKDTDIGTKEASASFSELYGVLKEKVFGIDKILDDIISDDDPLS